MGENNTTTSLQQKLLGLMKRFLVVQNFKIAESRIFILSKLFDGHSSGENVRMKESD